MMSPRQVKLVIQDAKAAGYEVFISSNGTADILKLSRKSRKVRRGLIIYPDCAAFDATVDLSVAKTIVSEANARKVLGI